MLFFQTSRLNTIWRCFLYPCLSLGTQTVHFKPKRKKLFANCVTAICTVTIRFVGFHSMLKSSMFFIIHDDLNITVIFSHIVKCYIVNVNLCKQRNKRGINCLSKKKNLTFTLFFFKKAE